MRDRCCVNIVPPYTVYCEPAPGRPGGGATMELPVAASVSGADGALADRLQRRQPPRSEILLTSTLVVSSLVI